MVRGAVLSLVVAAAAVLFVAQPAFAGDIEGRVFEDVPGGVPNQYDPGMDVPVPGLTVFLERLEPGVPPISLPETFTGVEGTYAFRGLPEGTYRVRLGDLDTTPYGCRAYVLDMAVIDIELTEEPVAQPVVIEPDQPMPTGLDFPVVRQKPEDEPPEACTQSCTSGHLHEALVLTDVYVGDLIASVAVSAVLYDGCARRSKELDIASLGYQGTTFPGPSEGLDGVLTIEDVRIQNGWGTVALRITADPRVFPGGAFGNRVRRLTVTLNGRRSVACTSLRCENLQPGGRFPLHRERFRVADTIAWESWAECNPDDAAPPPGPVVKPPPPRPRPKVRPPAPSKKSYRKAKTDKSHKSKKSYKSKKSHKSGKKSAKSKKKGRKSSKAKRRKDEKKRKQRHVIQPALAVHEGDDPDDVRRGRRKVRRGRRGRR